MNTFRFGTLFRHSASQISLHRLLRYTGSLAFNGTDGESAAYHHARVFRKPLSNKFSSKLLNTVSLIGFVDRPIRVLDTEIDRFGVFTFLKVNDPRDPKLSFRIFLCMWDGIARKCIANLMPNDFIHVSGYLLSNNKNSTNGNGGFPLDYKVKVREVNYVVPPRHALEFQKSKSETGMEESKNEIYLWQVFFANPYEWWDNRVSKKNPRQPDFKHKDTGEALWLNSDNPVWVSKQLQLLDERKAEESFRADRANRHRSCLSDWVCDE